VYCVCWLLCTHLFYVLIHDSWSLYLLRCTDSELRSSVEHTRECDKRVYCVGCVKHCDFVWSNSLYIVHLGNGRLFAHFL